MTDQAAAGTLDLDYTSVKTIDASIDTVFDALTTLEGLSAWWTPVTGNGLAGGELKFGFGPDSHAVMRVDSADADRGVHWTNVDCMMPDWIGTTIHFELEETDDRRTELRFRHAGLTPRLECFADCKSGWDHFIPSLCAYAETGTGHPNGSDADLARRDERAQQRQAAHAG